MTNRSASAREPASALESYSPLAGFLSYLVPGLGQIMQGRIGKGLLFFFCVYGLFWYGNSLSRGEAKSATGNFKVTSNVYLPDVSETASDTSEAQPGSAKQGQNGAWNPRRLASNLYNRPQFAGQFWVGIAAWPAVYQYLFSGNVPENRQDNGPPVIGNFERTPPQWALIYLIQRDDKTWDLAWVFTVVAGVLNVLVIYDAAAGPLFQVKPEASRSPGRTVPT